MAPDAHDIGAAARALVAARRPGAILQVEARIASLIELRTGGLDRTDEGKLLERAWQRVISRLPDASAERRAGWNGFDAVLAGDHATLLLAARGLLASLVADPDLRRIAWQIVLVKLDDDADRALLCDWADDVGAAPPGDVIAWVEPYGGADWRHAGRMPNVTLEATLSTR